MSGNGLMNTQSGTGARLSPGFMANETALSDRSTTIDAMPRPANPDVRRRLLAAGLDLVHSRGFSASGVKDITDAAGVPKGSFYAYFPKIGRAHV